MLSDETCRALDADIAITVKDWLKCAKSMMMAKSQNKVEIPHHLIISVTGHGKSEAAPRS